MFDAGNVIAGPSTQIVSGPTTVIPIDTATKPEDGSSSDDEEFSTANPNDKEGEGYRTDDSQATLLLDRPDLNQVREAREKTYGHTRSTDSLDGSKPLSGSGSEASSAGRTNW